jgi:RHS repeat-associated protein
MATGQEIAEAVTPEIQALARGLENDVKRIFDFVHDHIRYSHYFGSKKGAQLTLLERSGNDFDQSALLVALLRSAGHTASYRFAPVYMPYESEDNADFKHWVGLSMDESAAGPDAVTAFAASLNSYRGFPYSESYQSGEDYIAMHRIWVRLTHDGQTYDLDPAFKVANPVSGINLGNAIGLSTNDLMTAAAGTSTADYVQSLNEAGLRDKLKDYTTNLLHYIQTNCPNAPVQEVLGGGRIVSSASTPLDAGLPFTVIEGWTLDWDNIPTNLMSNLKIIVDGTTNRFFLMPQLQGQRLSLTFSAGGLARLWLEDELLLQKQTSGASRVNVAVNVDHPYGWWDWDNNTFLTDIWGDQSVTNNYLRTNASYAITYAFEPDQEWLRSRQDKLNRYRQEGLADTSREVLTETLNIMGLHWMLQTERLSRILASQQDTLPHRYHRFGRMAQEFQRGYYIDVYQQLDASYPASGDGAADMARSERVFELQSYFDSAAEHAMIEQLQPGNLVASSTVKMLQIGSTNSQRLYQATGGNWAGINASLTQYNKNHIKTNYIDKGYTLFMPANGSNRVAGAGSWAGYGMAARRTFTNGMGVITEMTMRISGGYNGSYASDPNGVVDTPCVDEHGYSQPFYFDWSPPSAEAPMGADPVDMADGSFRLTSTDLSLGQREPRGVSFTRHYSSSRRLHNLAGMANGWIHNYYLKATDVSAPLAGLGDTTPAQMAPIIVATKAAIELYDTGGAPKNWGVTTLISKWGLDQLIKNAVSVALGEDTVQFIKQPGGVYTPPAGLTMGLLRTNGVYWLQERRGNTFKFNTAGLLTNIVDQYNQGLVVTYNSSNWVSTIKDWKNRQLTLGYSGAPSRLSSITDNTSPSRTVSFSYTATGGQLDLTGVTDPEGKTTAILYDTNHQVVATRDALNRVVVSNIYDGFGRVIEQYSKGDTNQTWRLFWSGFHNTEKDPDGGRTRYEFDDKHRLIGTTDPLGHHSQRFYDGQDHVVQTVSQLQASNSFSYDGRHNLVLARDPLGFTNAFLHDTENNLVRSVDARGNPTTFGYNSRFQMTGATNGAGDWTTFAYNPTDGARTGRADAGGTTSYGYDSHGHLSALTHPGSLGVEGMLNDSRGDVLSRTNARGFVTTFQYNQRRELTNTIAPTNLTASVVMDAVGNVLSTTDARGFTTSNTWSATRKLLSTTLPATPQGAPVTTNLHDSRDWLIQTLNPLQQATVYTNDAARRLISVTDPLPRTTRFGYDADNHRTSTTNAADEVAREAWNGRGELVQATDGAERVVQHGYDGAGNRVVLTNRNGKVWEFLFDAANRLTNTISPLGRETKQAYNDRGLLQTVIEPSDDATSLYYDARGRLTNRTDNVGTVLHGYDANNNRTCVLENGLSNTWTFDAYDRVSSHVDAAGYLIQYRRDANGNVTNLVYPGGKTVVYQFDTLSRLTNVTDWANRKTSIEYDLASQVRKITRPNGTIREMNYDSAGQLTNIVEKTAAGNVINLFKLSWNAAARVEWEFAAPLPHAYTPPSRTMTFDDDNRILTFNGENVIHDLDGNMTGGPLTNNTLVSYAFDARNRLRSAGGLSYAYDPSANRIAITNGAEITRLIVNPNAALSQVLMRVRNGVTNYYVYGLGLLYEADDAGNTKTYHFDYRGSTVAITDGSGNVTDRIEYSAYGSVTYRYGTTDTPFLFNGRYGVQTDANGLLCMRARYYNPYICRFINADPSGFDGGLNFYAYADGNPVSYIDPFGLCSTGESGGWSWFNYNTIATALVPGQTAWNSAVASFQNGNYGSAAFSAGIMLAEQMMFALTWGISGAETSAFRTTVATETAVGGIPATTPIGRSGSPMNVVAGANKPATINGIDYSAHALDQMQGRGLMPSIVENTLATGTQLPGNLPGTSVFYDAVNNLRVVVNPATGKIITVIPGKP